LTRTDQAEARDPDMHQTRKASNDIRATARRSTT